jgi:nucleoside-diphosphate-sugar epimerase
MPDQIVAMSGVAFPLSAQDLEHVLAHATDPLAQLRGRRIFITGGTGFFGSWLLESLVHANATLGLGAQMIVLTRNADAFKARRAHVALHPSIEFREGDVRSFEFPVDRIDYLIHAATSSDAKTNQADQGEMLDTIVGGTRRALECARACGVRRMLFTSSGAVYGTQPPEKVRLDEDFGGVPDTHDTKAVYGRGKREAERLCASFHEESGLAVQIVRGFSFVGPYLPLDAHFAIGNFIRDALNGGPIRVKGDKTAVRSYMYAADLVIWLLTILLKGTPCRSYNVGSEEGVSVGDLARTVAQISGTTVDIARQAAPNSPVERYVPSVSRAREELGLSVRIGLEEAIRRTLAWARAGTVAGADNGRLAAQEKGRQGA